MAKATTKASVVTTLVIGKVSAPVALFGTVAKPGKLQEFVTAGPHGGRLMREMRGRDVPAVETKGDPLADELGEKRCADGSRIDRSWEDAAQRDAIEVATGAPSRHAQTAPDPSHEADVSDLAVEPKSLESREIDPAAAEEYIAASYERMIEMTTTPKLEDALPDEFLIRREAAPAEYVSVLVEEGSGEVVEPDQVRRGVRREDGSFVDCTAELKRIEEMTQLEQMTVVGFVDITAVPRMRMTGTYYVGAPDAEVPYALALLGEALRRTRRAAVVKVTKRSRQSLGVIAWSRGVLVFYELVFSDDFREPPARAKKVGSTAVAEDHVNAMVALVQAMAEGPDVVYEQRDDAVGLRAELHARAMAGEHVPADELVDAEVIEPAEDLLEQLAASLGVI